MSQQFSLSNGAAPPTDAEMRLIARILHDAAGIVIAPGKGSMVQSRLAKRLRALGLPSYESYLDLVQSDEGAAEKREMISALTTNVTHFFRESHHFDMLRDKILPPLVARAKAGGKVRIWSAGCSIGQEAYSIGMVLAELVPDPNALDIKILCTDIDPVVTAKGRAAIYDASNAESIPADLRRKYIENVPQGIRVIEPLRRLMTFNELNLHAAWPMKGKFDVIFCRNVVIYFDPPAQAKLWQRFGAALAPEGWLMVGHSERVPTDDKSGFVTAGITAYRHASTGMPPKAGEKTWH